MSREFSVYYPAFLPTSLSMQIMARIPAAFSLPSKGIIKYPVLNDRPGNYVNVEHWCIHIHKLVGELG